jgi:thiamine biosynthesis lipoprotein
VRGSFQAMGTTVDVLVETRHAALIGDVEALFARWEATLTRFSPDSELSRLNDAPGTDVAVSELLFTVVTAAVEAARGTAGWFDPTLLRQLEALGYDRTFAEVRRRRPMDEITGARTSSPPARPGGAWRDVHLDPARRTVRLPAGAGLDLGGIAKGMAVDAAISRLTDEGSATAAVDAGGDLAVLGLPAGESGWSVRIELPEDGPQRERPEGGRPEGGRPEGGRVVRLDAGALATSGTSRRRWWMGGREVHHLIDPETGRPAQSGLWSATAVAHTCQAAEVAATTTFLLGPSEGAHWLDERDLDGLLVLPDGRQVEAGPWAHP